MKRRILIADDDRELVLNLKQLLEFNHFETVTAYEGIRVVELARKQNPDLIILDIKMPAGDGHSVLQNLKSRDETMSIPVLILTGLERGGLEEEMKRAGAEGFLKKPYETDLLLGKINFLLGDS